MSFGLKFILFISLIFVVTIGYNQGVAQDAVYELDSVKVVATIILKNEAAQEILLNKDVLASFKGHSIAELLQSEGFGFIKTYGVGSIATSSIRGGAAGQMAVFWNDLPIQSPMLGQLDLSILSLGGIDRVQLKKGGQSASLGSGAVAGTIQLGNEKPVSGFNVELHSAIGSFAQQKQSIDLSGGWKQLRFRTRVYKNQAENNFPFRLKDDLPIVYTKHARVEQKGFQQSLFWDIHPQHKLQLHYWQQKSDRQIPPTSVQTRSKAQQQDEFQRLAIHYKGQFKKAILTTQLAYFNEKILFEDPLSLLQPAPSYFKTYIAQASIIQTFKEHWYSKIGLQTSFTNAEATGYRQLRKQNKTALYQILSRPLSRQLEMELGTRLTMLHEGKNIIGAYHLKLAGIALENIHYHLRISRDYRIPTLNDLYWIPGGNLNLQTEYSLGQEVGFFYKKTKTLQDYWTYKFNIFNRNVNNWIQWTQSDELGFWAVDNITKVWSRGIEQSFTGSYQKGGIRLYPKIQLNWIKSTYQESLEKPAVKKGDLLWYTPKWQAFTSLKLEKKQWSITYSHQWTGATNGINEDLDSYHLGYLLLKYQPIKNRFPTQLFARFSNVWNQRYRVIERRPMPGRAFELGLNLSFNNR